MGLVGVGSSLGRPWERPLTLKASGCYLVESCGPYGCERM